MFFFVFLLLLFFFFFFFFQAEDGIRDADVTGVQTCALPIFLSFFRLPRHYLYRYRHLGHSLAFVLRNRLYLLDRRSHGLSALWTCSRSEERRVGKECRYRWWPYH